jgi:hypothetical protein
MYTDVKASDGGPHDLLTSSLTEEQSVLGPSNGTLDNVMYTDVKASDGGPHDLLTSSLTEEQSMLGPSVANILHATLACSARRRMVRRLVNDELKELRVNCMWCLGSIAE